MLSLLLGSFGLVHYIALFVVLSTAWYFYRRRHYGVWEAKGFPSIPPNVLFGNKGDLFMGKEPFMTFHLKMYNDFKGHKIAVTYDGDEPQLMIRDPDLIKQICITDFDHFVDFGWFPEFIIDIPGNDFGLVMMRGEKWKKLKSMMTPLFNLKSLKRMTHSVDKAAKVALTAFEKTRKAHPDGFPVEDLCGAFTMDCVAGLTVSIQLDAQDNPDSDFIKNGKGIMGSMWRFLISEFSPTIAWLFRIPFFNPKATGFIWRLVEQVGDQRGWKDGGYDDMFDAMLKVKNSGEPAMTKKAMVGTLLQFFVDGFDTVNFAIFLTLLNLANNPEAQEKIFDEIEELGSPDEVTGDDIANLKYLDQVFLESMRMHSIGANVRQCNKAWKIPGYDVTIPKGMKILLAVAGIHMDEQYHSDPERFDPDRFSPENKGNMKAGTYMPFGLGPRMCLGYQLGKLETKIFLYHIVKNYRLEACSKTLKKITKESYDMNSMTPKIKDGVWMKFVPRE